MNNLKKIIIVIVILIIMIITVLIILLNNIRKEEISMNEVQQEKEEIEEVRSQINKVEKEKYFENYLKVKECIKSYISMSYNVYDAQTNNKDIENANTQILSIIPDFVKKDLNLNSNNIYETIGVPNQYMRIDNMYETAQTMSEDIYSVETEITAYIVKGVFINKDSNHKKQDFTLIVMIDEINETYYIIPEKYIEKNNINLEEGNELTIYTEKEIPNNTYNIYNVKSYSTQDIAEEYINIFKENMEYDPEYIYNKLDEEYKQKRFGTYQEFEKYVQRKSEYIAKPQLAKYKMNVYDDYIEYVLVDKNDDYYIIRESAVMDYSLVLDTYTVDTQEYIEKYSKATDQEKVANCINKFIKVLNDENYRYAYEMLADSFKNNYFKTQQEFENYAKQNLLGKTKLDFSIFKNEGNVYYTYTVKLSYGNDTIEKTFVVKLEEGTSFKLSFNVN